MAKDRQGKFAPADFVPQLPLERYWNRSKVIVPFAVDSTDPGIVVLPTGMTASLGDTPGSVIGRRWVIKGATVQPELPADMPAVTATLAHIRFQLVLRETAALLAGRDDRVLAECKLSHGVFTEGAGGAYYPIPLDIVDPMPFVAGHLSCCQDTETNHAEWAAKNWLWKLYWGWEDAHVADYGAIVQMQLDMQQ